MHACGRVRLRLRVESQKILDDRRCVSEMHVDAFNEASYQMLNTDYYELVHRRLRSLLLMF